MDIQNAEFTIEDILNMHRYWITKLYVEDRKTDVEIVDILHDRRFLVTLSQIRRCIGEWGLVQGDVCTAPAVLPEVDFKEDWEWIPSRSSPTPSRVSHTPSDLGMVDLYSKKALPSIPPEKSEDNENRQAPSKDRLKVTCHHGPLRSQVHEVETTLSHVPVGPTPLQTYTADEQSHEIFALSLDYDRDPLPVHRRSGEPRGERGSRSRPRQRSEIVLRRKK